MNTEMCPCRSGQNTCGNSADLAVCPSRVASQELPPAIRLRINNAEAVRDRVLAYQNPKIVRRIARDLEISVVEAEGIFQDTLRFLFLCGALHGQFAPATRVDDGWHAFLLFTEDYADFCGTFFGALIQHNPRDVGDNPSDGVIPRTKNAAKFFFGELSKNWSYKVGADCCNTCSCESCSGSTNCQN